MYDKSYYRTLNAGTKLPLRWCPPEVFEDTKFAESSDVWSFGVTLIEVFTKAATPYYGTDVLFPPLPPHHILVLALHARASVTDLSAGSRNPHPRITGWTNAYVCERIKGGYYLPRPDDCPETVYTDVIEQCFKLDAGTRPGFAELQRLLLAHECTSGSHRASTAPTSILSETSETRTDLLTQSHSYVSLLKMQSRTSIESDVDRSQNSAGELPSPESHSATDGATRCSTLTEKAGAIRPSQSEPGDGAIQPYEARFAAGSAVGRQPSLPTSPTYLPLARYSCPAQLLYAVRPSDPSDIAEVVLPHIVTDDSNGMAPDGVDATGSGIPNTGDAPSRRRRQTIV